MAFRLGKRLNKKSLWVRIIAWSLVILWLCMIWYFSAQPGSQSKKLSDHYEYKAQKLAKSLNAGSWVKALIKFTRKFAHIIEYIILSLLLLFAYYASGYRYPRMVIRIVITCLLCAAIDEIHQFFVPGRTSMLTDVFLDTAAALAIQIPI